ncbi:DUF317 domain-containing protein [Streptomyces globisporus]|uniref:DUF317 domain-containing protein n=1 Tax=Streptomyces globisporus TaxID=1908 RepID=UPI00365AC036
MSRPTTTSPDAPRIITGPDIDGDVLVSPRYLAGTHTPDEGFQPLLDLGWTLQGDELGNAFVAAPDNKVRLGFLPEGPDDGLWRVNAYDHPFGPPHWGVSFNDSCPVEFVSSFTTALARAYREGPDAYLAGGTDHDKELSDFRAVVPLLQANWKLQHPRWGMLELQAPDGLAGLEYKTGRLDPAREVTTMEARWYIWGGPVGPRWYATASSNTPAHLVAAITASICDPTPVPRWENGVSRYLRDLVQMTPIEQPAPLKPTPLDVRRAAARRAPALSTRSVPRWSTASPPAPAAAGARLPARR